MSKLSETYEYLDLDNYILYAAQHYHSRAYTIESEFEDDVKRFHYIKRLILKWLRRSNKANHRLLTNHLITVCNVFGVYPAINILRVNLDKDEMSTALTILAYLQYIDDLNFSVDIDLVNELRNDDI